MAWESSNRRAELPSNWESIRERILRRDQHRCTWIEDGHRCTQPATDVDHIRPGDDHRDQNLRSLCYPHHKAKTLSEAAAARKRIADLRKRPIQRHPGLK